MHDVFLSYSREDAAVAERLAEMLAAKGYSVWWDRKLLPGAPFSPEIEAALANSRCVIVLWSPESIASGWVRAEATEGLQRKILIPLVINGAVQPLEFRQVQSLDLSKWFAGNDPEIENDLLNAIARMKDPGANVSAASIIAGSKNRKHALGKLTLNLILLGVGIAALAFLTEKILPWLGRTSTAVIIGAVVASIWPIASWVAEDELKKSVRALLQRPQTTIVITSVLIVIAGLILWIGWLIPAHEPVLAVLPFGSSLAVYLNADAKLEITVGDEPRTVESFSLKALYLGRLRSRVNWLIANHGGKRRTSLADTLLRRDPDSDAESRKELLDLWLGDPPHVRWTKIAPGSRITAKLHLKDNTSIPLRVTPSVVDGKTDIVDVVLEVPE